MAIEKRFIHFKKFSDFNSKKLSANEANTQYTVGVSGEIQNGDPDILYQSYVWIKDTKQQWTHGQLYDGTNLNEAGFLAGEETSDQLDDVETLTYVKYVPQTLTDEQKAQTRINIDAISGSSLKTINGESLVGSGNIVISGSGGTGTVGPQGPQGEQGPKGDNGADGVSITSVKQTTTSTADGGTNVVTVTLSNGTTSTFNIKNGSKGSTGSKGDTGATGANGSNGATFTPSVDAAGNLSWSNDKGLANPPTVNIKGPKGDNGDAGEGGSINIERIYDGGDVSITLQDGTMYIIYEPITSLEVEMWDNLHIGSTIRFMTENEASLTIISGEDVCWVNGIAPVIEGLTNYELSIATDVICGDALCVLTPFKPVE